MTLASVDRAVLLGARLSTTNHKEVTEEITTTARRVDMRDTADSAERVVARGEEVTITVKAEEQLAATITAIRDLAEVKAEVTAVRTPTRVGR